MSSFIQEQNEIRNDYENENIFQRKRYTWRYILCNNSVLGWMFIAAFALIVPILTYYFIIERGSYKIIESYTCYVDKTFRVSCGKLDINENDCLNIACCYDEPTQTCYHYLPSLYSYDLLEGAYKASRTKSPFNTDTLDSMKISINEINSNKVSVYLHQESDEVSSATLMNSKNYYVNQTEEKLLVEIFRPNGDLLLSTAKGPLIASENYWEWTIHLTEEYLFGINQSLITLDENSTFTKVYYNNRNDQSSMPVFWAYNKKSFHGVSVIHDGPLEMTVLPSNLVVLRSITGGIIQIVLSVGPTPKLLHDQQRELEVENLPYWVMGTHECQKQENVENVTNLIQNIKDLDSEADSYCIDENLFMYLLSDSVTSLNETEVLNEYIKKLSSLGKKFLLTIPPQVIENSTLYKSADKLNILYKLKEKNYKGKYLGYYVGYPDYSHVDNDQYLKEINNFLVENFKIDVDGFVLKDNWPENEDFSMDNESFAYFNKDLQDAMSYTIQWNATSNNITHIQNHNSYGASQYNAFQQYYTGKSKIIMSATNFFTKIEPTFIENVDASWENLRSYMVNNLFSSIAGNHLVSLPICGDTSAYNDTFQESLCLRWYLVAATMPLFRLSSTKPWRNPDEMKTKYDQQIVKDIIEKRKMLLPYYYAILRKNEPVIRPMFYDYYENTKTFFMDNQYMIGEKLLVAHPLTSDKTSLNIYLPPKVGVWFEFWAGQMYKTNTSTNDIYIDIRDTDFIVFVAQGSIIPLVKEQEINLIVALNCTENEKIAEGSIEIEDFHLNFLASDQSITINSSKVINYKLGYIKLYSYDNITSYKQNYIKNINFTGSTTIYYVEPTTTETTNIKTESTSTIKT